MRFSTHRNVKKAIAAAAVGAATAAVLATTGGTALAATPGSVTYSCQYNVPVTFGSNGVNIHSAASTSSTVVGQGQYGQTFEVCNQSGSWESGTDKATGVFGWVQTKYFI